jgi:hypothetical protein
MGYNIPHGLFEDQRIDIRIGNNADQLDRQPGGG